MNLRIDIETFSGFDLKKVGVYRYVEHPDFSIMLFGCRLGDEPTAVYDWTCISRDELRAVFRWVQDGRGDNPWDLDPSLDFIIPQRIAEALVSDLVEKNAFNAAFERVCLRAYLGLEMPPEAWRCTMVKALYCGLPGGLDQVGEVLRLNVKKDPVGRALIKFFCCPCKPTKKNGGRTRNLPSHDPQRWQLFIAYCGRDVDSEAEVDTRCSKVTIPTVEWRYWAMHQRMLDAGVKVDRQLIASAVEADAANKQLLTEEAVQLTGLDNPNSVEQLKAWLTKELDDQLYMLPGAEIKSLTKKTIPMILERVSHETVERVLELRLELGRASVKKYMAMDRAVCDDGRIRGMQQFYGANRTGRDAGRIVQLQNMMTNKFEDFEDLRLCRDILLSGDSDLLAMLYPSVSFCLAQLIRTALVADDGLVLAPVDFSAVEARGLAWAANEKWRLDVFNSHGQIYEASASQMFKVPWSEFQDYIDRGKKHPLRQKGKIAELALGYWGGANALVTMGALEMGLSVNELQPLVDKFREANPNIKKFTYAMGDAALRCVRTRRPVDVDKGIRFKIENNVLMMRLPSGRELCYVQPRLEEGDYGAEVTYAGQDQKTKQWKRLKSYGGKWCIAEGTPVLTKRGWVSIESVTPEDRVWDGDEWVSTGGTVFRGFKKTIEAYGIRLTPEHLVLTEKGWANASQSAGLDRAACRLPVGYEVPRVEREKVAVGGALRLRERDHAAGVGNGQGEAEVLRVSTRPGNGREESNPRHVEPPSLRGLEIDARSVPVADPSRVEELRREGNPRLQTVGVVVPEVLGGHGPDVQSGVDARTAQQRQGLLPGELRMGDVDRAGQQPTAEKVFDLLNCGPRHRFVVAAGGEPLIVHNCENFDQAHCRDVLFYKMAEMEDEGLYEYVRFHVHDEVVPEIPPGSGIKERIEDVFGREIPWCKGMPLRGDGFETPFYRKEE